MRIEGLTPVAGVEPTIWFVVFHPQTSSDWLSRLTLGRWKHVSTFAYVARFKVWIFYDAQWAGLRLVVGDQRQAEIALSAYIASGCEVLKAERAERPIPIRNRLVFNCVSTTAHLLGLASIVFFPDSLYTAITRNGGEKVSGQSSRAADRP